MYVQSVESKDPDIQHKQASKTLSFSFLFFFLFFLRLCPVDIPEIIVVLTASDRMVLETLICQWK